MGLQVVRASRMLVISVCGDAVGGLTQLCSSARFHYRFVPGEHEGVVVSASGGGGCYRDCEGFLSGRGKQVQGRMEWRAC